MCTGAAARFEKDLTIRLRVLLADHEDGHQRYRERSGDQQGQQDAVRVQRPNIHCAALLIDAARRRAEPREMVGAFIDIIQERISGR
ncbi:MAG TPA: hypothetical protein VJ757_11810 [Pseudonocardiaceae bacterium]|nr:hypothetical protein [Pseudonocardiaceae bacterium]